MHALNSSMFFNSSVVFGWALKSPIEGAGTTVFCATSSSALTHAGGYFEGSAVSAPSKAGSNDSLEEAVWEQTEKEIAAIKARTSENGGVRGAWSSEEKRF